MILDFSKLNKLEWQLSDEEWHQILSAYHKYEGQKGPNYRLDRDELSWLINAGVSFVTILLKPGVIEPKVSWPEEI